MSFFAKPNRYLARGTRLMIHERKLSKQLVIDGPLTTCIAVVRATLNEIECSIAIQNEGFQNLVLGSSITLEEVLEKAPSNWYLEAQEAHTLGLVEAVLQLLQSTSPETHSGGCGIDMPQRSTRLAFPRS